MKSNESGSTCRICGSTGGIVIPIFSENAKIADKINKCLPVNINENDIFSKYICPRCLSALNVSYNLYILAETIDKISKKGSSQIEIDKNPEKNDEIIESETEETEKRFSKENDEIIENETEETEKRFSNENDEIIENEMEPTENNDEDDSRNPILEKSLRIVLERLPDTLNNNDFEQIFLQEENFENDKDHTYSMESFESAKPQNTEFETIFIKIDEEFLMPEEKFMEEVKNSPKKRRGRPKRDVSLDNSCDNEEKKKKGRYDFRKKDENYRKKVKSFIKLLESNDEMEESEEERELYVERRKMRRAIIKKEESSFSCSVCDKIFRREKGLKLHMNIHLSPEHWNYQCKKCEEKFPNIGSLSKHRSTEHPSHRAFICNMCDSNFASKNHMEEHKVEEHFTYVSYDED